MPDGRTDGWMNDERRRGPQCNRATTHGLFVTEPRRRRGAVARGLVTFTSRRLVWLWFSSLRNTAYTAIGSSPCEKRAYICQCPPRTANVTRKKFAVRVFLHVVASPRTRYYNAISLKFPPPPHSRTNVIPLKYTTVILLSIIFLCFSPRDLFLSRIRSA